MRKVLYSLLVAGVAVMNLAADALAATPTKKTVKEFLQMSPYDTTYCELRGVVTRVRNYEWGNLYIDDGTGDVLIYGVRDPQQRAFRDLDIRLGDTLTVHGRRFVYDGRVIEMKGARYAGHTEGPDHANVGKADSLDKNPTFKGKGINEFSSWVSAHLVYPEDAKASQIDGKVLVSFVVGRDGKVYEPQILEGLTSSINEELKRVLLSSPKWKPGIVDGHPVRVTYTMPVFFVLNH